MFRKKVGCSRHDTGGAPPAGPKVAPRLYKLRVTSQAVEHVALSRAWVLDRLLRHADMVPYAPGGPTRLVARRRSQLPEIGSWQSARNRRWLLIPHPEHGSST